MTRYVIIQGTRILRQDGIWVEAGGIECRRAMTFASPSRADVAMHDMKLMPHVCELRSFDCYVIAIPTSKGSAYLTIDGSFNLDLQQAEWVRLADTDTLQAVRKEHPDAVTIKATGYHVGSMRLYTVYK